VGYVQDSQKAEIWIVEKHVKDSTNSVLQQKSYNFASTEYNSTEIGNQIFQMQAKAICFIKN